MQTITLSLSNNCLVPLGGDFIEVVAPFKDGTTAGRLLDKRGEGGYMIIMQTDDAKKRREHIESQGLARVIFYHEHNDAICVQYHPKGIKGALASECHIVSRAAQLTEARWCDPGARQPPGPPKQSKPRSIAFFSMACMRAGSQGLLPRHEA